MAPDDTECPFCEEAAQPIGTTGAWRCLSCHAYFDDDDAVNLSLSAPAASYRTKVSRTQDDRRASQRTRSHDDDD